MLERKLRQLYHGHQADENSILQTVLEQADREQEFPKHRRLMPLISILLCVCILFLCAVGYFFVLTTREYQEALGFFRENQLSETDFSRREIYLIWQDIVSGTFARPETLRLFESLSEEVYGAPLLSSQKEDLLSLWEYRKYLLKNFGDISSAPDMWFSILRTAIPQSSNFQTEISKYKNGEILWTSVLKYDFQGRTDDVAWNGGLILAGTAQESSSVSLGVLVALDSQGSVLWEQQSGPNVTYDKVLVWADRVIVFGSRYEDTLVGGSRKKRWYFCFSEYDLNGTLLNYREHLWGGQFEVLEGVVAENQFFLKLRENADASERLISVSSSGDWSENLQYWLDGKCCLVKDLLPYRNVVYLSVCISAYSEEEFLRNLTELREEYYAACEKASSTFTEMPEAYDKVLCSLFSSRFSAALLLCDPMSGVMKAYEVRNASCGQLFSYQGELRWTVFLAENAKNVDMTEEYWVDLWVKEVIYCFDSKGKLLLRDEQNVRLIEYCI